MFPTVHGIRQDMLISEGFQVLHDCVFLEKTLDEKEKSIKSKTPQEIRTMLRAGLSTEFKGQSQMSGGHSLNQTF